MRRRLVALIAFPLLVVGCSDDAATSDATMPALGGASAPASAPTPAPAPPGAPAAERVEFTAARGESAAPDGGPRPAAPFPGGRAGSIAPAMIIRTGTASVEVRDLDRAVTATRRVAARLGGFVGNTTIQGGRDQVRSATLELKIPAARFDEAVAGLGPLGRVESVSVEAHDVGEELVDVRARVANGRRLEERLIVLLATRTGRLEDVLAVERELARVREEVERAEGRLRYLESHVAVSSLSVTVHEPHPVLGGGHTPIADAVAAAGRNFVEFVAWLIAASGILAPLGAIAWATWRLWRRRGRPGRPSA